MQDKVIGGFEPKSTDAIFPKEHGILICPSFCPRAFLLNVVLLGVFCVGNCGFPAASHSNLSENIP